MKLRPLHDRLLVKRIAEEEKTKGGLIIPDTKGRSQRSERIGRRTMRVYVFAPNIIDGEREVDDAGE